MARRIIIGVVLTLLLLAAARRLSVNRPADLVSGEEGLRVYHRTVTEMVGPGQPRVQARIDPAQHVALVVRWITPPSSEIEARGMWEIRKGLWEACFPELEKGTKIKYWITVATAEGRKVRMPGDPEKFGVLSYKGKASNLVVGAHVLFMFGAFFFMVMSFLAAIGILRGREDKKNAVRAARGVLASSFIGGWPLGLLLNYQTFGKLWEGFPFGYDVTDNKTQVIFILWLVSLLLAWGSFTGKGEEKDRLGRRAFALSIVACFVVSLILFILPHSI
ncbi:MAG: hypothetical protein NTW97_11935 [Candidatus Krumholzibacteria bacterium]|nr:hypothetical protein [Candidatus Krumholzibacteria bacterium]